MMTRLYPLTAWVVWAAVVPLGLLGCAGLLVVFAQRDDLVFDHLEWWWLSGAVVMAGVLLLYGAFRRKRALERFASAKLAPLLVQRMSPGKQAARAGLFASAVAFLVMGLVGPRWGIYMEQQRVYGRNIVVAVDVSRSMLAADVEPNRFERAKREIRQQLTERGAFVHENRLALLAFAGSTSLRLPLTTDIVAFREKLEQLRVGSVPRGGTAIGEAIRAATDLFARSPEQAEKIVLLFTDGEDHEGGPIEAAQAAWEEHGIRVFTIGVGDPQRTVGAQVPAGEGDGRPLLDDGQIVFSRFEEQSLREIALAGSGDYAPVQQLFRVVNKIGGTRKAELSAEERMRHQPRYQWFVAAALLLLMLETMMTDAAGPLRRKGRSGGGIRPPKPGSADVEADQPMRVWQQEVA